VRWRILVEALCSAKEWQHIIYIYILILCIFLQ
jgi:hypothetical protein